MEWTDEHAMLMLSEMIVSDVFSFKKGSVGQGDAWDSITEKVNHENSGQLKIREEEVASGVIVEDLTEKEVLIEELNRSHCW